MKIFIQKNTPKIGKYGRPIFWAYVMVFLFQSLIKIIGDFFTQNGRDFIISVFDSVGDVLAGTLLVLLPSSIFFAISIYRVTHPYISRDEHDDRDINWGMGLIFIFLFTILHFLLLYLFDYDLYGQLTSWEYY